MVFNITNILINNYNSNNRKTSKLNMKNNGRTKDKSKEINDETQLDTVLLIHTRDMDYFMHCYKLFKYGKNCGSSTINGL